MSRKGNCWDNAPTERFFRSLKHEALNYENFKTREAHSKLGYQSPLQFERVVIEKRLKKVSGFC
jgi:transposase InsO family protein